MKIYRIYRMDTDTSEQIKVIQKRWSTTLPEGNGLQLGSDERVDCFGLYILLDPISTLKGYIGFTKDINEWIYRDFKRM